MTRALRTAFVMEQSLGHVTHYRNLREFTASQPDMEAVWLPIPFEVRGAARFMPIVRSNWSVRASWQARRVLGPMSKRVDAVVFHTQTTSLFATDIMRQIPSLVSLDATPINYDSMGAHYSHRPAGDGFIDQRKYELHRRAFHAARCLVTWSEWARRSLIDDYSVDGERVQVVAPGASEAFFEIGRRRQGDRAQPANRPVRLLFVGGDFARKGGPELLASLDGTLNERCQLDVVTQANLKARPNVKVHRGVQPNSPELLHLFADADVFVLPTHGDCLALALMEATAAGLPVITTDVGALGEAVIHGQSGLLVQAGDVHALSAALAALACDAELRQRMGRAGHALAMRTFNARKNNRVLLDLVASMAETQRNASRRAA